MLQQLSDLLKWRGDGALGHEVLELGGAEAMTTLRTVQGIEVLNALFLTKEEIYNASSYSEKSYLPQAWPKV